MNSKVISICLLVLFFLPGGVCVYLQEQKTGKPFEKIIYPKLLIDAHKGEKDKNYLLSDPSAVTTDSAGNIYIINSRTNQISKFDSKGKFIKMWGSFGTAPGRFKFTGIGDALTVGPDGLLYVVDRGRPRIQIFNLDGKYLDGFYVKWGDWPDSIAVAKNGDIYLSVPPVNRLKRRYTIHLYKKSKNGYEFVKGFSDSPIWLEGDDITPKENLHVTFSAMSHIAMDSENNIYQIFMYLPIIRKFNPSGEMLWQKTINIRALSQMKGKDIMYYENEMEPQKADRKNIILYVKKRFTNGVVISHKNSKIYIFHTQKSSILELSLDGKLIGAYYPSDFLLWSHENFMKYGPKAGKIWGFMNFTLNKEADKVFFVELCTGELWVSKL